MKIRISKRWIGEKSPVFIIAEAGINHNGNLRIAKKLVSTAKSAGADAVKFQTFKAFELTSPTSKFFHLFKKMELNAEEFTELSDHAKSEGIIFCSTPFSLSSVDLLHKLKVPFFKIASGDLTYLELIKYAAKKLKPIIISTGMANLKEIKAAISEIRKAQNNKIIIMHSVSSYPTPPYDVNLNVIEKLSKIFPYPIGYSDNGSGILVPLIAVAKGAKVIEKHFTLNKKMKGPDHSFSADPRELKLLVKMIREVETILGEGHKVCQPSEIKNKIEARRSITAITSIDKEEIITKEKIGIKRPATGISPVFVNRVIGKIAKKTINKNDTIQWTDIK